jgi:hypothetical protein
VIEDDKLFAVKEAQEAENVIALLNSDFPDVIGALQLFQKFAGNNLEFFHDVENKENLLGLLVSKRVLVFLHRAFACFCSVKE